jgi:hypothetical protein
MRQLFYEFSLDEMIPKDHPLRRINDQWINGFATAVLAERKRLFSPENRYRPSGRRRFTATAPDRMRR